MASVPAVYGFALALFLVLTPSGVDGRSLWMQVDGTGPGEEPVPDTAPLAWDGMKSIPCPVWGDSSCTCYGDTPDDPILLFHFCPEGTEFGNPPDELDCPWLSLVLGILDSVDCTCYGGDTKKLSCAVDATLPDTSTGVVHSQQSASTQNNGDGKFECPEWVKSVFSGECDCFGDPAKPSLDCHGSVTFGAGATATVQSELVALVNSVNDGEIECPAWVTAAQAECVCFGQSEDSLSMVSCGGSIATAQSEPVGSVETKTSEKPVDCPKWTISYFPDLSCECYGEADDLQISCYSSIPYQAGNVNE